MKRKLTELGMFLQIIRIQENESQAEMASYIGVHPSNLSAIERGAQKPPKKFKDKFLEAYELSEREIKKLDKLLKERHK